MSILDNAPGGAPGTEARARQLATNAAVYASASAVRILLLRDGFTRDEIDAHFAAQSSPTQRDGTPAAPLLAPETPKKATSAAKWRLPDDFWARVPGCARFAAMDEDKTWCFWRRKPGTKDVQWLRGAMRICDVQPAAYPGNWRDSLQKRPEGV